MLPDPRHRIFWAQSFLRALMVLFVGFCGGASLAPAQAPARIQIPLTEKERAWQKAHPVVTLAVDQFNPPMNFKDGDGQFSGLSLDYMRLISAKSGLTFQFKGSTWNDALGRAMAHEVDGVMGARIKEERRVALNFSEPYVELPIAMLTQSDFARVKTLDDFRGKRIAVVKGTVRIPVLQQYCPTSTLVEVAAPREGAKAVVTGEADAFFDDLPVVQRLIEDEHLLTCKIALLFYYSEAGTVRLAVNKNHPELLSIVDKAIASITPAEHHAIRSRWLRFDSSSAVQRGISLSAAQAAWLREHPVIRVGIDPNREPVEWRNKDGEYVGISVEYLHRLEQVLGIRFEIAEGRSWKELLQMMRSRQVDVLLSVSDTPEGRTYMSFTTPYFTSPVAIFSNSDTAYIHDLRSLNGKRVAVLEGLGAAAYLRDEWPGIELVEVGERNEAIKKLRSREVFAYVGGLLQTSYVLGQEGAVDIRMVGETPYTAKGSMGVRSDWAELAPILQTGLDSISAVDRAEFQHKWLPTTYRPKFDSRLLLWLLVPFSIGLLFILQLRRMVKSRTVELQGEIEMRKRQEAALQESEARYRRIVETTNEGIWVLDSDQRTTFVNRRVEEMLGYSAAELAGEKPGAFVFEEDLAAHMAQLQARSLGQSAQYERRFRRKDGTEVWTILSATPWQNPDGSYAGVVAMLTDITARKSAEAAALQSQKLESVGRLAGGMAHDINNMLTAIMGHIELLEDRLGGRFSDEPAIGKHLTSMTHAAERSKEIIAQLLAFSRKQVLSPKVLNPNSQIAAVRETLAPLIGEDISLVFNPGRDPWNIQADPSQLDQVVMNLVINARDAMPNGGTVTLETANVTIDQAFCMEHPEARPGGFVRISVMDTGTGMDPQTLQRIFEPFFTTKGVGKGTGLGLSTVFGIVAHHGGFILVDSHLGQGTTFQIHFARVQSEEDEVLQKAPPMRGEHQGTVLVVDDDPHLTPLLGALVRKIGYRAVVVETASEAMAYATNLDEPLDLLMTDVVMPGMNGRDLRDQIQVLRPGLVTLFMSGYTDDIIAKHGVLEEGVHLISKPFVMADLEARLHSLMGANAAK